MDATSLSLLKQLRQSEDSESWSRLADLYTPLLHSWLGKYGVQQADADDLIQDVLMVMAKELPAFEHNGRAGAFRAWLRTILVNRLRNFWRTTGRGDKVAGGSDMEQKLEQLADPSSELSRLWDKQHDQFVVRRLLAASQPKFAAATWQAFRRVTLDGVSPERVAAELGISVNAVFIAKSRVLSRLRREADGMIAASSAFLKNR